MELYTFRAFCTNVVDGDTADFVIDVGFKLTTEQRVRFLGVNTPERNQTGYKEATEFTRNTLLDKDVFIQTYKADSFGRYLADIYYENKDGEIIHLNQELLDLKLAVPFKK